MKYLIKDKEQEDGMENEIPVVKEKTTRGKACPLRNDTDCGRECAFFGTKQTCRLLTAIESIAESAGAIAESGQTLKVQGYR